MANRRTRSQTLSSFSSRVETLRSYSTSRIRTLRSYSSSRVRTLRRYSSPSVKTLHNFSSSSFINSDAAHCKVIFEGTSKSSPQKPSAVKQHTLKAVSLCNSKSATSKIKSNPVSSADNMGKESSGAYSPQGIIDSQVDTGLNKNSHVDKGSDGQGVIINENPEKPKTWQCTIEEVKSFFSSMEHFAGFSVMSRLFSGSHSEHELKPKSKPEEERHTDLVDKAQGVVNHDVDVISNKECEMSENQNSCVKENSHVSVENNTLLNVPVEEIIKKSRRKQRKRIRKFYYATDSDEDVQLINESISQANHKESRSGELDLSSCHQSSNPAHKSPLETKIGGCQQEELIVSSESENSLNTDFISAKGFNIRRPTVLKIGRNGKRQTFDARVVSNTNPEVILLETPEVIFERELKTNEVPEIPSECVTNLCRDLPLGISNNSRKTRQKCQKTSHSSKKVESALSKRSLSRNRNCTASTRRKTLSRNCNRPTSTTSKKRPKKQKCSGNVNCRLDVVKLLIGDLIDIDSFILPESETDSDNFILPESETDNDELEVAFESITIP